MAKSLQLPQGFGEWRSGHAFALPLPLLSSTRQARASWRISRRYDFRHDADTLICKRESGLHNHKANQTEKETGRLEAFSDGVFAIAITLLVLELKVPEVHGAGGSSLALAKALSQQWPSYFGLVTSFFTVLIMWVHHHAILRNVWRTDAWLHFANGCLLLGVTFVPYPTSVLATFLETPAARMAVTFYAGTFVFIALCFYLFIRAAFRKPLLSPYASPEFIAKTCQSYAYGPPLYLVATLSALLDVRASLVICTALWIFWATTITRNTRA